MSDLSINRPGPVPDYTSLDYESIRADLISFVRAHHSDKFTDFSDGQLGTLLLGLVSYASDLIDYHTNSAMRELFTGSVRRKENLRNILRPFGLDIPPPTASRTLMRLTLDPGGTYPFTINVHDHQFSSDGEEPVFFQPSSQMIVTDPGSGYVDVECEEGEYFENILIGIGTGQPRQIYMLPQTNAIDLTISVTVAGVVWTRVSTLATADSTSRVYRVRRMDDGTVYIMFGDGGAGVSPSPGQEIQATFRMGGGVRGRMARGTIEGIVAAHENVLSVTNITDATGGDDEATLSQARRLLPRALESRGRVVNATDAVNLALTVPGVGKAFAEPIPGSRNTRVHIAPSGGGVPSPVLRREVLRKLSAASVGNRQYLIGGPRYRDVRFSVLLHVDDDHLAQTVRAQAYQGLVNDRGLGLLDFSQLGFGGLNDDGDLLVTNTRLQAYFSQIPGLLRAEVKQLDINPLAYLPTSNRGNGTATNIQTTGTQRRRQFVARFRNNTQFDVFERIVGIVSDVSDSSLVDDSATFLLEGEDLMNWVLIPSVSGSTRYAISGYSDTSVSIPPATGNLYNSALPGNSYALESGAGVLCSVGDTFMSDSGDVTFEVVSGSVPFLAGDEVFVDIYPVVSDIRLRPEEYPQVLTRDLDVRTTGGAKL